MAPKLVSAAATAAAQAASAAQRSVSSTTTPFERRLQGIKILESGLSDPTTRFITSQLSRNPKFRPTMLFESTELRDKFLALNSRIPYTNEVSKRNPWRRYSPAIASSELPKSGSSIYLKDIIHPLQSYSQLSRFLPFESINKDSNIISINPPYGLLESFIPTKYPNKLVRPNFFEVHSNHGVENAYGFEVIQRKEGSMTLSKTAALDQLQLGRGLKNEKADFPLSFEAILDSPILEARLLPYKDIFFYKLEKFLMDSTAGIIIGLFDSSALEVANSKKASLLVSQLLSEALNILKRDELLNTVLKLDPRFEDSLKYDRLLIRIKSNLQTPMYSGKSMEEVRHLGLYGTNYLLRVASNGNIKAPLYNMVQSMLVFKTMKTPPITLA